MAKATQTVKVTKVRRRKTGGKSGYSRDEETDKMVEKLEKMMEKAEDPNVRQAIEQAIDTIEM